MKRESAVPETRPEKVSIIPFTTEAGRRDFAFSVLKVLPEKEASREGAFPGGKIRERVPLTGDERTVPSTGEAEKLFSEKLHRPFALSTGIPLMEPSSRDTSPARTGLFHFPSPVKLMVSFPVNVPLGEGGQRREISERSRPLASPATERKGVMVPRAAISPLPARRKRERRAISPSVRSIAAVPLKGTEFTVKPMSAETVFSAKERPMSEMSALLFPNVILLPEISAR